MATRRDHVAATASDGEVLSASELDPDLHRAVCVMEPHRSPRARLRTAIAQAAVSLGMAPPVVYCSVGEVNDYAILDEAKVIRIEAASNVPDRCFWFRKPDAPQTKPRRKRKPKGTGMRAEDI